MAIFFISLPGYGQVGIHDDYSVDELEQNNKTDTTKKIENNSNKAKNINDKANLDDKSGDPKAQSDLNKLQSSVQKGDTAKARPINIRPTVKPAGKTNQIAKDTTSNKPVPQDTSQIKLRELTDADVDFETGRWLALTNDGIIIKSSFAGKSPGTTRFGPLDLKAFTANWYSGEIRVCVYNPRNNTSTILQSLDTGLTWTGARFYKFPVFVNTYLNDIISISNHKILLSGYGSDLKDVRRSLLIFDSLAAIKISAIGNQIVPGISSNHFLSFNRKTGGTVSSFGTNSIIYFKNLKDSIPAIRSPKLDKISILNAFTDAEGNAFIIGNDSLNHGILFKANLNNDSSWTQVHVFRKKNTNVIESASGILTLIFVLLVFAVFLAINYFKYLNDLKKVQEEREKAFNPLVFAAEMPTSEDTLNIFGTTVDSVVSLIKNPSTQPPLSIILSGAWGSGKSSLMAQIKKKLDEENKNLKEDEFVMLWFNVWHFQSAQHMLIVFLSSIMNLFDKTFKFGFRFNLFINRLLRLRLSKAFQFYFTVFLLLPLLFFLILELQPFNYFNSKHIPFFGAVFIHIKFMIENIDFSAINFTKNLPLAIPVASWIAGLILLGKEWRAWGIQSFFRVISLDRMQQEAKDEDPGFREKYKREFWEIMQACEQKNYIIFIDDTDRISGDKIKEMLEGINFITDTASRPDDVTLKYPRIYFIMAMAAEEVAKNLGENLINKKEASDDEKLTAGARYLEKIVDIVIPVPLVQNTKDENINSLTHRHSQNP